MTTLAAFSGALTAGLLGRHDAGCGAADLAAAPAFDAAAVVEPAEVGPGLWAFTRSSADGEVRVWCVYNPSTRPASFRLPGTGARFYRGGVRTSTDPDGGIRYHLTPYGYVWISFSVVLPG
ncbi:hypothetical protein [Catenuloplanes japonicus]|uniref:hypothetical protein n=1 Tax=Catenuloplanes japonicus TaxID=33876 RepID=UPI0005270BCC|nr:hypothetical protein [Catenuloplanes japonicus]